MEHLTSRDICKFAIMAEKFDPDNSIRMYDYAVPGFEDPETQISRMADHIRNEENYKNDAALHSVPDGLMVLLWALKTSEKIDVAPK